jgi:hypothetical protein
VREVPRRVRAARLKLGRVRLRSAMASTAQAPNRREVRCGGTT